jgi:hypothetical protein
MELVEIIYFNAGGGHRAAATALETVLRRQAGWRVQLTNLQQLLDPVDPMRRLAGIPMEEVYNLLLRRGWTRGSERLLKPMHAVLRHYHAHAVGLLDRHWRNQRPSLVVSVVPHFNRALFESLRRVYPAVPLVTVLTDFADFPPHFWIEPQDQFFICGTERAAAQAVELGVRPERVLRASGMIVHPRFYEAPPIDRETERARLGLDPAIPTGLVIFGGQGSAVMREIAQHLENSRLKVQLIFICGRNRALADELRRRRSRYGRVVIGFTEEVPFFMQVVDFFIGKPGPGSLSEALLMKLPVIVERNGRTMPQERYNVEWVLENKVGLALKSFREIAGATEHLLHPESLAGYRRRVARLENRAIFEMPSLLRQIRERSALPASSGTAT